MSYPTISSLFIVASDFTYKSAVRAASSAWLQKESWQLCGSYLCSALRCALVLYRELCKVFRELCRELCMERSCQLCGSSIATCLAATLAAGLSASSIAVTLELLMHEQRNP